MTEEDIILTSILNCRRVDLVANSKELTSIEQIKFDEIVTRRNQGEPLQYILGECDFMGIPLLLNKDVLIPRPETELLVDLAIKQAEKLPTGRSLDILDLGTGSGNIAIALSKNIKHSLITAVDSHDGSLVLARKNAKANHVDQKIQFLCMDMSVCLKGARALDLKYDMIISNPPYIPTELLAQLPEDVQKEPQLALDGGHDGLDFYRVIFEHSHLILKSHGFLLMEIGDGQRDAIETLANQYFKDAHIQFYKDYVGTDRIISLQVK